MIYQNIIRPIFFKTDPEKIHHFVIGALAFVSRIEPIHFFTRKFFNIEDPILSTQIGKVKFSNPVGLAAGFDKNITAPLAYSMLGFGSAELGSITYKGQPGNAKPRLWRIPDDKGLIVYYGLCNNGAEHATKEMMKLKKRHIPIGLSIAPTTGFGLNEMAADYARSFEILAPLADFITLNVSCPNVVGCDMFAQVSFVKELTTLINNLKKSKGFDVDVFVKIGPDMTSEQYDEIVDICIENNITAIVATNLVKNRTSVNPKSNQERLKFPGGISGNLVREKSNEVIKKLYRRANGRLKIIGLGGIFSAEDAYEKIKCGASALQLVTGFIYNGPLAIRQINMGLKHLLKSDGYRNIEEAVGKNS